MTEEETGTVALLTQLSRSVYRTAGERNGSASMKQFVALSHLRELGLVPQAQFGSILCLDPNNTVLLLNELEAEGLVTRRRSEEDRRRHVIELTDAGLDALRRTELNMNAVEEELLAALSTEQRADLRRLLHQALHGEGGVLTQTRAMVSR